MSRLLRAGASFHFKPSNMADVMRDFTITGTPEMVDGAFGRCVKFDGSTDYLTSREYGKLSGDVSFSYAARFMTTTSSAGYLFGFGRTDLFNGGNVLRHNTDGTLRADFPSNSGPTSSVTVNDGKYHTAIVYFNADTNKFGISVDGGAAVETTEGAINLQRNYPITVGCIGAGVAKFPGVISEVIIFPWALSTQEIANISSGDPFQWSRTVCHEYDTGGGKTYAPFSSAAKANIAVNLKSDGITSLGLTTLDLNDFKREFGVA